MKRHSNLPPLKQQHGIVLIVAMVMLVIMSILGISSVRTVALEERMSAASHDRNIALQAAEAALLRAETDVRLRAANGITVDPTVAPSQAACPAEGPPRTANGYVGQPYAQCGDDWMANRDAAWWGNNANTRTLNKSDVNLGNLAGDNTRYIIEYRGMQVCKPRPGFAPRNDCATKSYDPDCNCYLFRITARSNPGNSRADVILQTLVTTY